MKKKEKRHSFTTNCGCKCAVKKNIFTYTLFQVLPANWLVCKTNVKNRLYIFYELYNILEHFSRILNILYYKLLYIFGFFIYIHYNIVVNYLPIQEPNLRTYIPQIKEKLWHYRKFVFILRQSFL